MTRDSERPLLLRKVYIFISFLLMLVEHQKNITMHKESHLAGESSGKRCSIDTHQLQQSKSYLCSSSEVFFLDITEVM